MIFLANIFFYSSYNKCANNAAQHKQQHHCIWILYSEVCCNKHGKTLCIYKECLYEEYNHGMLPTIG